MFRSTILIISSAISAGFQLDLASTIGATHWNPCYWNAELPDMPVIYNGAITLSQMQTTAIKLALFDPENNFPWLSNWTQVANWTTVAQLAAHPYYQAVFSNNIPKYSTSFNVFALVTYRTYSDGSSTGDYWCNGITPADEIDETQQFGNLTLYLLETYAQSNYRFILQHWEGDWAARCGSYNASQPPTPAVISSMIAWLSARQAGVNAGRVAYCHKHLSQVDCSNHSAVLAAAGVELFHASEVNLILTSMTNNFPNNILTVIPKVALDMVSYSSYDTQALNATFGDALDFIAAHHVPTSASPSIAVYVGEYGVAQQVSPLSALQEVTQSVMTYALGDPQKQRAAHTFFWELFDNEADIPGQRCNPSTGPVWNTSLLHGFWLLRPNGTRSWAWDYLQGVINGSIPMPTPTPTL